MHLWYLLLGSVSHGRQALITMVELNDRADSSFTRISSTV